MSEVWTLTQAIDWLFGRCVEQYKANDLGAGLDVWFHQQSVPGIPPDPLLLRAFHVLKHQGIVTGHVVDADNGVICIRKLQLTNEAILKLEAAAAEEPDASPGPIGFSDDLAKR
jgi:hypothetical protein